MERKKDNYLTFENGEVYLEMDRVPGIFVSMRVRGNIRFDSAQLDQMSGSQKTFMGYEDADICLRMDLLCGEETENNKMISNYNTNKTSNPNRNSNSNDNSNGNITDCLPAKLLSPSTIREVVRRPSHYNHDYTVIDV